MGVCACGCVHSILHPCLETYLMFYVVKLHFKTSHSSLRKYQVHVVMSPGHSLKKKKSKSIPTLRVNLQGLICNIYCIYMMQHA